MVVLATEDFKARAYGRESGADNATGNLIPGRPDAG